MNLFSDLTSDLRFAIRMLAKDRWFTAVAAVTLALGIGANTTVFTLVNAVLIRGLPFEDTDRIMAIGTQDVRNRDRGVSYLDYRDWRDSTPGFTATAAFTGGTMNVSDEGRAPERYQGQFVSHGMFRLVGVKPVLGREFLPEDDKPGAAVVLLGNGVWKNRYGGDPNILGRTIRVNNVPSVVIGVMPEGFQFPNNADLWQPLQLSPGLLEPKRDQRFLNVMGRLVPGVTMEQAREQLSTITTRLAGDYPATNKDIRPTVVPYSTRVNGGPIRLMFLSLMGAVGFVLLIACANVANLLLARAADRSREISVRMSLGATRWQVVRQLLMESLLLAVIGGALGLALSVVGVQLFDAAVADPRLGKPYWIQFTMDARVFAYLAAVCLGTAVAFGLAPALHISKTNVNEVLKEGGRGSGGALRARRWTSVLLVAELALTLVLLSGAAFMMRSFLALYRLDLGVSTANVTTMRFGLPNQKYPTPESRLAFYQRLEERLSAIQSLPSVTIASTIPMGGGAPRLLALEGQGANAGETLPTVVTLLTGSRYFEVFALPVRGRTFTAADGAVGQEVVIINQRLAGMYFPNEDPIGRRIRLTIPDDTSGAPAPPFATIVGVVTTNVRQRNPQDNPDPDPIVYRPYRADPIGGMALIVRTQGDPAAATSLLREEVRALDSDLPLFNIETLDRTLAVQRWPYRVFGTMFAVFAFIALVLSAVGLYAVTAYSVTQRTQEIGVRMALGAQEGQVLWLFLRQAVVKLAIGLAIGLAGAFGVGVLLRTFLVQTGSRDPVTLASIALVLTAVSLAACYWPAHRATRLDPVTALRCE
ncbi:MAG: ABC transporter permease [Vicinamibacterales bacterium]